MGSALQTPPKNLVLGPCESELAAGALAHACAQGGWDLPGVVGRAERADVFALSWGAQTGREVRLAMDQSIFKLEQVTEPTPVPGLFRTARDADLPQLAQWFHEFVTEALPQEGHKDKSAYWDDTRRRIEREECFVWEQDGELRAMASLSSATRHAIRLVAVYTPPEWRGRGLASNLTARLSGFALTKGFSYTTLYTDSGNAASNALYRRVGYKHVCNSRFYALG